MLPIIVLLLLLLSVFYSRVECTAEDTRFNYGSSESTWEKLFGRNSQPSCGYKPQHMRINSIMANLEENIGGQNEGIYTLLSRVRSWEMVRENEISEEPLVVAITGPTGVGKSETAFQLANGLLAPPPTGGLFGLEPESEFTPGLLVFQGGDYSEAVLGQYGNSVAEMRTSIKEKLFKFMDDCSHTVSGRAIPRSASRPEGSLGASAPAGVVLIDEVEKMAPGSLDDFVKWMSKRGIVSLPHAAVEDRREGAQNTTNDRAVIKGRNRRRDGAYSTANLVFILVSDVGADELTSLLLRYKGRPNTPRASLVAAVQGALDQQWGRLTFSKTVTGIVPYLPLEPEHIEQITHLKVQKLSRIYRGKRWLRLIVDDGLVQYFSSGKFNRYVTHNLLSVGADECKQSKNCSVEKLMLFSELGARSLENGGPLQDLRALIYLHMRPWRPDQILHVGFANRSKLTSASVNHKRNRDVYLQWCSVHDALWAGTGCGGTGGSDSFDVNEGECPLELAQWGQVDIEKAVIDDKIAFSPICETVWFGNFDKFGDH